MTQVVIVGEAPGKGWKRGESALLGRIGKRLAGLMGMSEEQYQWNTVRVNLFSRPVDRWFPAMARRAARRRENGGLFSRKDRIVILLGRNVAKAFGFGAAPWFKAFYGLGTGAENTVVVVAPHPSGKNHWWNDPRHRREAKKFWQMVYRRMAV